jgi:hypothetical protein
MKIIHLVLPLAAFLAGCGLFFPCEDRPECGSASILITQLDPGLVGAVEFTIRRKDLPSEQVTCRWQAKSPNDAGATAGFWNCDPTPDRSHSTAVEYDDILVQKTDYELSVTGPAGTTTIALEQGRSTPGDGCSCSASYRVPDSAWVQVGAL